VRAAANALRPPRGAAPAGALAKLAPGPPGGAGLGCARRPAPPTQLPPAVSDPLSDPSGTARRAAGADESAVQGLAPAPPAGPSAARDSRRRSQAPLGRSVHAAPGLGGAPPPRRPAAAQQRRPQPTDEAGCALQRRSARRARCLGGPGRRGRAAARTCLALSRSQALRTSRTSVLSSSPARRPSSPYTSYTVRFSASDSTCGSQRAARGGCSVSPLSWPCCRDRDARRGSRLLHRCGRRPAGSPGCNN